MSIQNHNYHTSFYFETFPYSIVYILFIFPQSYEGFVLFLKSVKCTRSHLVFNYIYVLSIKITDQTHYMK